MVGKILPYTSHVLVCSTGELRPGLYGWMSENAEVLELLAFWKPEQQAAHRFRIWRPLASSGVLWRPPSYKNRTLPASFRLKILKSFYPYLLVKSKVYLF